MKEQRLYGRFDIAGNIILHPKEDISRSIKADILNIGYLGIGINAKEKIEAGTYVKFELITKLYVEPIIGEGTIIYTKETQKDNTVIFKMGIKFVDIDNGKIKHLLSLIQHDIISKLKKVKNK